MEIIVTIKDISLLIGIWVAIFGIDSWRREHTGKRQIELAEETLELFYAARDAISYIRFPANFDYTKSAKNQDEKQIDYIARIDSDVVFTRYNERKEIFNKLSSIRYRFMAQFGEETMQQFDDMRRIVNDIFLSAQMLAELWPINNQKTDEFAEKYKAHVAKHESILWDCMNKNDPINLEVDRIVKEMEKTCKKAISGQGSLYYFLNLKISK